MHISSTIREKSKAYTCVSPSALGGKLVVPNAFDSKETPSHRVGVTPCYCDKGDTLHRHAAQTSLAAIGAATLRRDTSQRPAGITE